MKKKHKKPTRQENLEKLLRYAHNQMLSHIKNLENLIDYPSPLDIESYGRQLLNEMRQVASVVGSFEDIGGAQKMADEITEFIKKTKAKS